MQTLIIEPHDSFIARDGRPFGLIAGVRASSLPFPFPSTTTGGVRTRAGLTDGVFDDSKLEDVKSKTVCGPLLVELDWDGCVTQWFAHAPADALLLDAKSGDKEKAAVRRLAPQPLPADARTNLPDNLLPLYLLQADKSKPHGFAPRFWRWNKFLNWLADPKDSDEEVLTDIGTVGPPRDERSHVNIEGDKQTHEEGGLFQTRGLEFTRPKGKDAKENYKLEQATRLALAVTTDATGIKEGIAPLGGERRLVCWREFKPAPVTSDLLNSKCPDITTSGSPDYKAKDIRGRIIADKACRVVLLTPACFDAGWKPNWLTEGAAGVTANDFKVTLRAAAMGRAQVISGWDLAYVNPKTNRRGSPKPTRRLVPAGSVFFLQFQGDDKEIVQWINNVWMCCVSDSDTDRRDGFGLAALGTWPEGKEMK